MLVSTVNAAAGSPIAGAIRDAARATGTSFEYLLATARVESGLNPKANATTSSARGLFQFIDQTWLATIKRAGAGLGYGRYADAIVQTSSGRFEVPDPAMRRDILALRSDAGASAAMAGAFTSANASRLADKIGRPASDGELYIAHFLGAAGAAKLITATTDTPQARAAGIFPNAAAANRSIFYSKDGSARSVSQVYGQLVARYDAARTGAASVLAAATPASISIPPQSAASPALTATDPATAAMPVANGPLFHDLFSGDRREAVSPFVRELWATRPQVAAALTTSAVSAAPASRQLDLFRDMPPNAGGLFTHS